uniref:Leucine-rich receptor-protein kinase-like protein n=1 Tax=Striga gesnerioides TaxID=46029 RepID=A0A6B7FBE0_STRGE|nr:leucine-rich receptor-protein kinase-like protein [Striga gesnerioides]
MMNTLRVLFMATLWIFIMRLQGVCPELTQEGHALIAFKNRLNDPNNALQTWGKTDNPCSGWNNITCDDNNHVIDILLAEHELAGELGPELSNLTELKSLNMLNNNLTGPIPKELGLLKKLVLLDLRYNQLTGIIPRELGNCDSLLSLYLNDNQLSGAVPLDVFAHLQKDNGATIECDGNPGLCVPPYMKNICCP